MGQKLFGLCQEFGIPQFVESFAQQGMDSKHLLLAQFKPNPFMVLVFRVYY
jgi:hypothetical protein